MAERPYSAGHGSIQKVWEDFADRVNAEAAVFTSARNVFGCSLTGKNCKARFFQLMEFAKKYSANEKGRNNGSTIAEHAG